LEFEQHFRFTLSRPWFKLGSKRLAYTGVPEDEDEMEGREIPLSSDYEGIVDPSCVRLVRYGKIEQSIEPSYYSASGQRLSHAVIERVLMGSQESPSSIYKVVFNAPNAWYRTAGHRFTLNIRRRSMLFGWFRPHAAVSPAMEIGKLGQFSETVEDFFSKADYELGKLKRFCQTASLCYREAKIMSDRVWPDKKRTREVEMPSTTSESQMRTPPRPRPVTREVSIPQESLYVDRDIVEEKPAPAQYGLEDDELSRILREYQNDLDLEPEEEEPVVETRPTTPVRPRESSVPALSRVRWRGWTRAPTSVPTSPSTKSEY
jgi:hypothetical protein